VNYFSQFRKVKKKRILVLSTGGPHSGVHCLYVSVEGDNWELLAQSTLPYPELFAQDVAACMSRPDAPLSPGRLAGLDQSMTLLLLDAAKVTLAQTRKPYRQPHVIVLDKCGLFRGSVSSEGQTKYWDMTLGDAQLLASSLDAPVISDFVRHSQLAGSEGRLPLFPGTFRIAKRLEPVSLYVNIGLIAHVTAVDNQALSVILDSDVGPGTCLINKAAQEAGLASGFDRDGKGAAQGKVDNTCVEKLSVLPWFLKQSPKSAFVQDFENVYKSDCLKKLQPVDKMATLAALTARTAFDVYKREFRHAVEPETVWVSGGGAHNSTLVDFLSMYFNPLPVKTTEAIGVAPALFTPLALGLTVYDYLMGNAGTKKAGVSPEIYGIGRWCFPE